MRSLFYNFPTFFTDVCQFIFYFQDIVIIDIVIIDIVTFLV